MDWILNIFGTVLRFFNDLTHSYLFAILLFAICAKILLFPFSIKQQKNSVKQAKMRPKEMAIRKKYKGTTDPNMQRRMQEEIQELYQKEGFNPMGGCLPLLLQLPLILIIYNVIRNPLRYICGASKEAVAALLKFARGFEQAGMKIYEKVTEIDLVSILNGEHSEEIIAGAEKALGKSIEYSELPDFTIFGNFDLSKVPSFTSIYIIIPILTGIIAYVSTKLTQKLSYQGAITAEDPSAKTSNIIMDLMMPLMSVWMSFMFPAMLGIYWMFQNILGVLQQLVLKKMYPYPKFTQEDYKRAEREINGKKSSNRSSSRTAPAPGTYRSLHRIDDDEVYTVPDKTKKSASEAPKLKEDAPDHKNSKKKK